MAIEKGKLSPPVKYVLFFIVMFSSFQPVFLYTTPCIFSLIHEYILPTIQKKPIDDVVETNIVDETLNSPEELRVDNEMKKDKDNLILSGFSEATFFEMEEVQENYETKTSETKQSWYIIDNWINYSPIYVLAVILSCLLPVLIVYGIVELLKIKKAVKLNVKNSKSESREGETQTSRSSFALMDEINSLTEAAMIFSNLKKLSFELISDPLLRDEARLILTDEFLHVVAARISGDVELKNTLPLLQPETLLKMGQMYQEIVTEQQDMVTEGEKKTLKVNLDLRIDGKGGIQLTDSEN